MSSYEEVLERGRQQLDAVMEAARERNRRTRTCNGQADCTSREHFSFCPKSGDRLEAEPSRGRGLR